MIQIEVDLVARELNNIVKKQDMKQMKLKTFCDYFDVPRTTALQWVHTKGFPAYNLSGRWYVDIDKFYKWRSRQTLRSS